MNFLFILMCLSQNIWASSGWQKDQNIPGLASKTGELQHSIPLDQEISDGHEKFFLNKKNCILNGRLVDLYSRQCASQNIRCTLTAYAEIPNLSLAKGSRFAVKEVAGRRGQDYFSGTYSWTHIQFLPSENNIKLTLDCQRKKSYQPIGLEDITRTTSDVLSWSR